MQHLLGWSLGALALASCSAPSSAPSGPSGDDASSGGDSSVVDALSNDDGGTRSGDAPGGDAGSSDAQSTGLWSTGYYAGWPPTTYPVADIEWSGLTHIAFAFYEPQSNGTLSLLGGDSTLALEVISAAHAHGAKAIASIGGSDSGSSFQQATSAGAIDTFASNLANLITVGYDGIDIDWEPLTTADEPTAIDLAHRIRNVHAGALMTIAIGYANPNAPNDLSGYPAIAAAYDQLNIMSYGMAGAWPGWKSWHDSPLYNQDSATPLSIDSTVTLYLGAGVPASKLGVGIGFFGLCYTSPVTGPDQALGGSTIAASDGTMSYTNIMTTYYATSSRAWDAVARVPYLSYASPHAPDGCTYISYDDEQSIAEKGTYVKAKGLGGVMQWEINEGYLPAAASGQKSPLLDAIRDHVLH
jgi:chitinase